MPTISLKEVLYSPLYLPGLTGTPELGKIYYVNNNTVTLAAKTVDTRAKIHGMGTGIEGLLILGGPITLSSLTANSFYFLDAAGVMSATATTTTGHMVLGCGQALTTEIFVVQFRTPFLL
jgi:hypothetical protein